MEFTISGHNSLLGDLAALDTWLVSMGVLARSPLTESTGSYSFSLNSIHGMWDQH
jgi:hypothetical protein